MMSVISEKLDEKNIDLEKQVTAGVNGDALPKTIAKKAAKMSSAEVSKIGKFKGLRRNITAEDLFKSQIIDKKVLDDLNAGKITVDHVSELDSVRKYLQGTNCIAGVFVQATKQVMSIYEAKCKSLLTPGTSLVLLEAQAATGFIIDPVKNRKLSVEEGVDARVVGSELKSKLLSAERAVTGYTDPYTENTISLFQAMKKDLIVKDHGIRLLEAQIATGGIIDPVNSHRIPVQVAYEREYFDEEMNLILSDPSDDTKGFFDPNTQENLTYLQLLDRCVRDPVTGLSLLVVVKKGEQYFFVDEKTKSILKSTTTTKAGGHFSGKEVSLWELLYSQYVVEEKRREIVEQFKSGVITIEQFTALLLQIITEKTTVTQTVTTTTVKEASKNGKFKGLRRNLTAQDLFKSQIIDKKMLDDLNAGKITVDHVSKLDFVQKYLQGTNCIAGVFVQATKQVMSIYEAKCKSLLTPGTSLVLLEAQAATGFLIDPVKNRKLSVEEGVDARVVGSELKNKLLSAEQAVTGYTDPYTGNTISLFQAMKKDLIVKDHGIRLLEAQIATGGIIDPVNSHRIPVQVAYEREYFDEEMNLILSDPSDDTKGFFDPNTQENLTYLQLLDRCVRDPVTGLSLLVVVKKGEQYFFVDEKTKSILKSTTTTKAGGHFSGKEVSLWELLYSQYVVEEKRRELVEHFKSGVITIEQFTALLLQIITEKTTVTQTVTTTTAKEGSKIGKFKGLRRNITAEDLFKSQIIDKKVLDDLNAGKITVNHVSELDSVRKYLQGTNCIAGVFVQATKQVMSIYEAKCKSLLTPGTSLVLLEAQAATGFIIDPVKNRKLSVEEGVDARVVGSELKSKLLSAERAVTGYTDPYTENTISLFQAMKKDLIVKDHGIRLLEAQIATGGIIDPVNSHRIPVQVAYEREYFDEEMNLILSDPSDDTKGFFDPNTQENLTYLQLLDRCVRDPVTGLSLLVVVKKGEQYFFVDEKTKSILKSTTTTKAGGHFSGKEVSLWELLYSQYVVEEKRREIVEQFKSGVITIEQFTALLLQIITEKTTVTQTVTTTTVKEASKNGKFKGLRRNLTAQDLFKSQIIDKKMLDDLNAGKITVDHVSKLDFVQKYLQGTNCIAGVFVQATKQVMSIYEAKCKSLLTPGTSLVLLEAQAATGFLIDPVKNRKLSVEEGVDARVVGSELKNKLLSAEQAVTGYTDPYTGNTISLFQAMKKDLIVKDHGIRLLEAQIATGGIIDPVNSHRIPVQVAYEREYFDEEMNLILSDPSDDTKGFFDPNTQENLTYLQLLDRCVRDPVTGLSLLVVVKKGEQYFFVDEKTKSILKSTTTTKAGGHFSGKEVSLWELLYSQYVVEEKRRELVEHFKSGVITIEQFTALLLQIITEKTTVTQTVTTTTAKEGSKIGKFKGLRRNITAEDLFKSQIIDKKVLDDLNAGKITVNHVSELDSVRKYLQGTNCIAGVFVQATKQVMSIYEAKCKSLLTPGTSLVLLEAQAATGFIIDPVKNRKLSVEEGVDARVVGSELKSKLLSAERAVTGYTDPYTGNTISLFQAMKKDLIVKDHGIRLLEAQIATGGIIDPVNSHRIPVQVAYEREYFDEEMNLILSDPSDDTKGFFDPNTQENLTYLQLLDRCVRDPVTGLSLLVVVKKGEQYFFVDEKTKSILKSTTTTKAGGHFSGKEVSLWELLYSQYVVEEKRRELVEQYKSGVITIEQFTALLLQIIREKTTVTQTVTTTTVKEASKNGKFKGLRRNLTAQDLFKSQIIDKKMLDDLNAGKITVDHVSKLDSVQKYLQGTNCIAGVFVQATKQVMSIYEAKCKSLLTPGTSLVLLEAQAATGFIIDPVKNRKLSVEEGVDARVVGSELKNKLLSAEQAVTGYTDPYTGNTISLFQAMKKDLIVKDHGIRLLEAQIATGGIIDPVNSHRIPVQVAYEREYFDEEMNLILSDPSDDTNCFFDPNTQENLTYLQLLDRCVRDPVTGLSLLVVVKKGEQYFFVDEKTKSILKSTTTTKAGGHFSGKEVSLWELLYSQYVVEEKRRELVEQYKSGVITIEQFTALLLQIIREKTTVTQTVTTTTVKEASKNGKFKGLRRNLTAQDLFKSQIIDKKMLDDLNAGKITVDHVSKLDSVQKYLQGTNCIAGVFVQATKQVMSIYEAKCKSLLTPGTSLVLLEAQAATGFIIDPVKNRKLSVEEGVDARVVGSELKNMLLSAEQAVTGYTDPYTGNTISLFQAMKKDLIVKDHGIRLLEAQIATGGIIDPVNSHRIPVQVAYEREYFDEEMNLILSDPSDDTNCFFDPNTQENLTYLQLLDRCVRDPVTGLSLLVVVKKGEQYFFVDEKTKSILKSTTTTKAGGHFSGKEVSLWELLYSQYVVEEKRRELVEQYKSGVITIEQFTVLLLQIITEKTTVSQTVTTTTAKEGSKIGKFKGLRRNITAEDLFKSEIIDKKLLDDLNAGKITVDQVSEMDSVRKYLQGTNCIAGVFVQGTKQVMSIYEAKCKSLLTPGTSLVLLEAQAATGFIIDPVKNRKLSVEEGVDARVVGSELKSKLLSAERAVTGYTDPYTGNTISLFQAMKKDLIVKDHGIRLLEAQIATGGIIDPVNSHRIPVQVAYEREYFDEEMNLILSDPSDDTKGFFDPNTQENLTYLQLIDRCVRDPETGLFLLPLRK
ncbi:epiplakin [Paramormyrops kingsleyae]|uniref:epiplakin n=1 Tax=Paramormyrops kingsleyae TaxID=1676925 RepID=UPI003B977E2D